MAPTRSARPTTDGTERVRHELLTALHFGRLTPGGRAPSVRRLASRTGMNRKTVHRAYTRLAGEGLLDLRPGSGTFISEELGPGAHAPLASLLSAAEQARAEALSLGLPEEVFASFLRIYLAGNDLRGVRLAVAECNREQLGIMALELRSLLRVHVRPVLLADLAARPRRAVEGVRGLVTTDCHRAEVLPLASALELPLYRVAFDPDFPRRVLARLRRGPVMMVVKDARFAPVFRRLLDRLSGSSVRLDRLTIVEPGRARRALRGADDDVSIHLSPLVDRSLLAEGPAPARRLRGHWRVNPGSLRRLRARLALELAWKQAAG